MTAAYETPRWEAIEVGNPCDLRFQARAAGFASADCPSLSSIAARFDTAPGTRR
jgi:hypothetical protein